MPLITSNYKRQGFYFNHHFETIIPSLFRKVKGIQYDRERINTPDNDFLDIDWMRNKSDRLVIIGHGLEGSSDRPYMKGMAKAFSLSGYDVLTWNYRGCSGEPNLQLRAYHSGATDDLETVVQHAIKNGYKNISLIGFSLGGNMVLKYIGENGNSINRYIKKGMAISVPIHLHSSCQEILKPHNTLYEKRFLKNLKQKVVDKAKQMPDELQLDNFKNVKSIIDFDDVFTAPVHGFKNAIDYYESCSALYFLENISIPTLVLNAKNDSFLSEKCYPTEIAETHEFLFLETPTHGGHCGFPGKNNDGLLYSELRAVEFISEI